jgi:hypothetical protein
LVNKKHPLIGVFFYIGRMPYFLSSLERYAFWHIFLASQNNLFKLSRRGLFGYTLVNRHFWVLPDPSRLRRMIDYIFLLYKNI